MEELKMELYQIRNRINVNKHVWQHIFSTNCYAFALGLDVREKDIGEYVYQPGILGTSSDSVAYHEEFEYELLLANIYDDLKFLGISFEDANPNDAITLDSWKIALMVSQIEDDMLYDYHFLRQLPNGIWYHKTGWYQPPTKLDSHFHVIKDPQNCHLKGRIYRKCLLLKLDE